MKNFYAEKRAAILAGVKTPAFDPQNESHVRDADSAKIHILRGETSGR